QHAELLEMPVGAAALFATQIGFDRRGRRLELGRSVYRGDRFDFTTVTFSMRRPGTRPETGSEDRAEGLLSRSRDGPGRRPPQTTGRATREARS
ncbi:MAG: UTRA domain-containing protein, partial [Brachybacterium tyrofermentans]